MLTRRSFAALAGTALAAPALIRGAEAAMPGVTAESIKIGQTQAYSGPASAYGAIGRAQTAFFKMINEGGGVNGRAIDFISVDDGYSPPRTVEQTRRLVEQEGVAFMFNSLGTPCNSAVHKYLNMKKVPQLFVATGADKWGDPQHFPWTMGWQPSYRTEAQIYAKHIMKTKPDAKIGILYQNDDFGKDYLIGLREQLGDAHKSMLVKEVTYEVTDPTIDSQAVSLQSAGVDVVLTAAVPKFAAQMIRKLADMNWKPAHYMTNVSISVGAVIKPAGEQNALGMISAAYEKDNTDPEWKNDKGMNDWRAFMAKYMPDGDLNDINHVFGYGVGMNLVQVLKQCGADLSRANIMKQAASLHELEIPILLPGIKVNTSATNFHPIRAMQLVKWTGSTFERFGEVIAA